MDYNTVKHDLLATLNANQREAVTSPASGVLQIVAGPGTGKTKVLISRVAYLLLHENILPHSIIVTTFTKKAANEMVERLRALLRGTEIIVGNLLIGTFHSICYKIIQKHGKRIGIENYSIADDRDASQILQDVLQKKLSDRDWDLVDSLPSDQTGPFKSKNDSDKNRGYDVKKLRQKISHLKATGVNCDDAHQRSDNLFVLLVYSAYQQTLSANQLLDFDDCLLYCHKIISRLPVLNYIEHTFVDEFQDTNEIQLRLMYEFAKGHATNTRLQHNVTIVGDPDQSIYAFRHAQSGNFDKMRQHYLQQHDLPCKITYLKENYRSTSDILTLSERIMRQQMDRTAIDLHSQTTTSFKPVKGSFESSDQEARWLAYQIKHLMKFPDLFEYSDMAILVRSAYQTRVIETELSRNKIPYFMVRGKAFWERKEVVAMVDYLRCVANENDRIAYLRCVNLPKRGLGPKAIAELDRIIEKQQIESHGHLVNETMRQVSAGNLGTTLGPKMRKSLGEFLDVVEASRTELMDAYVESGDNLPGMNKFFSFLYTKSGIQKEFSEDVNCDLNIMEVKSQLMDFEMQPDSSLPDENGEFAVGNNVEEPTSGTDFLKNFLALVTLFDTNPEGKDGEENKPRVAVSTIHGAKGLEWPVVFVPGVSEGLLPASFAMDERNPESLNEERRCFYVATTRAKLLLFVSSYTDLGNWGRRPIDRPSRFLDKLDHMFVTKIPIDSDELLEKLYFLMAKTRTSLDFDLAKAHRNYELCLNSFVRGDIDSAPSELGFTSVSKWNTSAPSQSMKLSSRGFQNHSLSFATKTTSNSGKVTAGKAPAYIPMRSDKKAVASASSFGRLHKRINDILARSVSAISAPPKSNFNSRPLHDTSVSKTKNLELSQAAKNRAPVYIPVRESKKRRLGTR